MTTNTATPAPLQPHSFTQRTSNGCLVEGQFHDHTGFWSAWVSKGSMREYVTASTRDLLMTKVRDQAEQVQAQQLEQRRLDSRRALVERRRQALLKKYPEVVKDIPGLPAGWKALAIRQPGGQPLWRVEFSSGDGYHVHDPKQTYATERAAVSAARTEIKRAAGAQVKAAKKHAERTRQYLVARETIHRTGKLSDALDLAWDIIINEVTFEYHRANRGVELDKRNGPANTCCASAPANAADSSRIISTDPATGAVLVKSVWWRHRSTRVHEERIRVVMAWYDKAADLIRVAQVPETSRSARRAIITVRRREAASGHKRGGAR